MNTDTPETDTEASMTQQEHLQLIKAKCVELLELAKRRTPGRWLYQKETTITILGAKAPRRVHYEIYKDVGVYGHPASCNEESDAAFIASAAGPFEAALASTVAAIDNFTLIHEQTDLGEYAAWDALQEILASWPLELLQQ